VREKKEEEINGEFRNNTKTIYNNNNKLVKKGNKTLKIEHYCCTIFHYLLQQVFRNLFFSKFLEQV
jgi:hypothetical protein